MRTGYLVAGRALVVLAACSTDSESPESRRPAATATTVGSSTTSSTAVASVGVPCAPTDLEIRFVDFDQAMNQPSYFFSVTNTAAPCTISGYPQVELLDADGEPIPLRQGHGGGFVSSDPGPREVTLTQSDTAWFTVSSVTICTGEPPEAPTSAATSVTLPGATAATIAVGIPYCPGGQISLSALADEEHELRK